MSFLGGDNCIVPEAFVQGKYLMQFHHYEYAGYLIPKDWCVVASLTSVHMDGMNYENPFEFDPWRWEV